MSMLFQPGMTGKMKARVMATYGSHGNVRAYPARPLARRSPSGTRHCRYAASGIAIQATEYRAPADPPLA